MYFQKDFECMTKEDIKKLQSEKLVKQVKYVYDNVNNKFLVFDLQKSPQVMYSEGVKIAILIPILAGLTQFIYRGISRR